jgi:hypothetical protein
MTNDKPSRLLYDQQQPKAAKAVGSKLAVLW